jgi:hypothetical protein
MIREPSCHLSCQNGRMSRFSGSENGILPFTLPKWQEGRSSQGAAATLDFRDGLLRAGLSRGLLKEYSGIRQRAFNSRLPESGDVSLS